MSDVPALSHRRRLAIATGIALVAVAVAAPVGHATTEPTMRAPARVAHASAAPQRESAAAVTRRCAASVRASMSAAVSTLGAC
ncbi:hypothetical protein ACFC0C_14765 [Streptomyces sp. NPDC056178]|uniref:hypothetical protein n=1 Tax=Streptomyces sp. NPDC056178 TaxID=3345735 RepID=UPI0035DA4310